MASLKLTAPENGKQYVFIINEGVTSLELNFDSANALFEKVDNNLLITLKDGSSILLENFYSIYSRVYLPEFVLEDSVITGEEFLAALSDNLIPAAGPSNVATLNQSSHTRSYDFTLTPDINNENVGLDGLDSTNYLASTTRTFSLNSLSRDLSSIDFNLQQTNTQLPDAPQTNEQELGIYNIAGSTGSDKFNYTEMTGGTIDGGAGDDVISINYMKGGNILGGSGYDTVVIGSLAQGFSGTIDGGEGIDTFAYGVGSATLFTRSFMGNSIALRDDGSLSIGTTHYDNIINFENLAGGNLNDTLRGNSGDNTLMGGDGDDVIWGDIGYVTFGNDTLIGGNGNDVMHGMNGNDILIGGLGADIMRGGLGDDTFLFNLEDFEASTDYINDFGNGSDYLDLTAYKQAGYTIEFLSGSDQISISNGDTTQYIQLYDMFGKDHITQQIQDQISSENFDGGIKII